MRLQPLVLILTLLAGCAGLTQSSLDARFGPADPTRFDRVPVAVRGGVSYRHDVKPILDSRCVVCHGCYDAPCQLKLGSWDGIARGATNVPVYGELRLREAPTTRLGIDAQKPSQWRERGFVTVLNERARTPANDLAASLLYRTLAHKQAGPTQAGGVLPDSYEFALNRKDVCAPLADYDAFEKAKPHAGMPYGLPALSASETDVIARWLQAGAPDDPPAPRPPRVAAQIREWEAFLNGNSNKSRLMARYVYEHLFLAHLTFRGDPDHVFRLVRSRTPPGKPVAELATRRPFDDPGRDVPTPYYRLAPDSETSLAKTRMPFELSAERMARWRDWFLEPEYTVDRLPAYAPEIASNPFRAFEAIPMSSRYRFLLDEAQFFVMSFIKGPVCRGQTALDVIDDRFWVFFVDPDIGAGEAAAQAVSRAASAIRLPAAEGSNASLLDWRALAASEDAFLSSKSAEVNRRLGAEVPVDLSLVWRGDGHNPNAALTVFRHFDSASVVKGMVGEPPKTAWLIGYTLLERIYYLLVAGYDVWGNTAHQLQTRLFMDFMRMEGESNFLMLLPRSARMPLRDHWYRGVDEDVKSRVYGSKYRFDGETSIPYQNSDPLLQQRQLYGMLERHLTAVLDRRHDTAAVSGDEIRSGVAALSAVKGPALAWWPEAVILRVDVANGASRYFSVLRDTGHRNVSTLFRENAMLVPEENGLTVASGFIGAYPNALFAVNAAALPELARGVAALSSEADYRALADRFAVRRTDARFWAVSDAMHEAYRQSDPAYAGLFDYGRLENR